jgi:hypothetical protein
MTRGKATAAPNLKITIQGGYKYDEPVRELAQNQSHTKQLTTDDVSKGTKSGWAGGPPFRR